jgi:hypothetical protein
VVRPPPLTDRFVIHIISELVRARPLLAVCAEWEHVIERCIGTWLRISTALAGPSLCDVGHTSWSRMMQLF